MGISKIAIIGGGPAGLAAAKALTSEKAKFTIDLYERRDQLGGVWNFSSDKLGLLPPVPSTNPNGLEKVLEGGHDNRFLSAMYRNLETNLIDRMMEYNNVPFEPRTSQFVTRSRVLEYVQRYASTIPEGVNYLFKRNVLKVDKPGAQWTVQSEDSQSGESFLGNYDAVVVANGHSELPYVPDAPGLSDWAEQDPKSVTHSKYYDQATDYEGQRVLIIGNYASGVDLATQISTVASHVYVSGKDASELVEVTNDNVTNTGPVLKYEFAGRKAVFDSGDVVSDIDVVIFCTGYLYSLPFLEEHLPGITDGTFVKDIYRQIFNVEDPTLSFIALPKFIVPMPLSEAQAAIVARVYSGRLELPDLDERKAAYHKELAEKGPGKPFHSLKPPADYTYCNDLYDWIVSSGLESEGLMPIYWGEEKKTDRNGAKALKDTRYYDVVEWSRKLRLEKKPFSLPPLDKN